VTEVVRLVRDLSVPIGEVRWPPGIALAAFNASLAAKAHALLLEAYADGAGSVPADFEAWWAATRHDSEFDAGLCFCAVQDDRLVGFALCWTSAFIKDIAVAATVRQQGVGEALLRTVLGAFKERGATEVALKVHSDNMPARRLYARVGFRKG
jgi:ribosomal protein S18 acetylase RimI-like enzyme